MATGNFNKALALVLVHEGGKCDDPGDPGGRTNCGITHIDYDAYRKRKGLPPRDVYDMDDSERDEIYLTEYWQPIRGDELPAGIDYVVFDGAVNSGVSRSVKWLQRALGTIAVDGFLGDVTLVATKQYPDQLGLIATCCAARMDFLQHLTTFKLFGRGWTRRVNDVEKTATAWASGATSTAAGEAPAQGKALGKNAVSPPTTIPGDVLAAAGTVGLATAIAAKDQTVAVTPPVAAVQAPAQPAVTTTPPATMETKTAPPAGGKNQAPPPAGTQTSVPPQPPPSVITISNNQFVVVSIVLAVLLILGLYLSWTARVARTRRADALGDNPIPKTPLELPKVADLIRDPTSVPLVQSLRSRVLSWAWIIVTLAINVIALAKLLQGFGLANENWHQPFYWLGTLYDTYAGQAFAAISAATVQNFGITLPAWLMPACILYISMASAFVVASTGLMSRKTKAEGIWGAVIHAGWLLALPAFVMDAIRYRVVSTFAKQNTLLFFVYILTFLGAYVGVRFINDDFLPAYEKQHPGVVEAIPGQVGKIIDVGKTVVKP